ncbi:MAG: hypothetical protein P8Y45_10260 [Exilibacterium sp.]
MKEESCDDNAVWNNRCSASVNGFLIARLFFAPAKQQLPRKAPNPKIEHKTDRKIFNIKNTFHFPPTVERKVILQTTYEYYINIIILSPKKSYRKYMLAIA